MDNIIKSVSAKSLVGIPILEGDYQKDGIYYCGKCHTPKRKIIVFQGVTREVGVLCSCGQADYEREQEEYKKALETKSVDEIILLIDELLEALEVLNPRLYRSFINKL